MNKKVLMALVATVNCGRYPPKGGKFFYSDYTKDDTGLYTTSILLGTEMEQFKMSMSVSQPSAAIFTD